MATYFTKTVYGVLNLITGERHTLRIRLDTRQWSIDEQPVLFVIPQAGQSVRLLGEQQTWCISALPYWILLNGQAVA